MRMKNPNKEHRIYIGRTPVAGVLSRRRLGSRSHAVSRAPVWLCGRVNGRVEPGCCEGKSAPRGEPYLETRDRGEQRGRIGLP